VDKEINQLIEPKIEQVIGLIDGPSIGCDGRFELEEMFRI